MTSIVWPAITYETLPWERDLDQLELVPKSRRRKITSTYEAAIPAAIADQAITLPADLADRLAVVLTDLARFDERQRARSYALPALLLRSESSSSSQIEHLTSSVRNVALAELSGDAPHNARLVAGNVAAMRTALSLEGDITLEGIREVHRELLTRSGGSYGGELREEQVWIGGTPYSPHGAEFVPPAWGRVADCLDDLTMFLRRDDLNPIVKAALAHAQFETIHPFIDGNGRTGRTLLHISLARDGVLEQTTLPISAGLLHDVDAYMAAIRRYQQGDALPMVACVARALELAVSIGIMAARHIDAVLDRWRGVITERAGASIHRLPSVLVEQPVINAAYLADTLNITPRASRNLIERACEYGMLRKVGNAHRGVFYQADEIIDVLEDISGEQAIRRMRV